MNIPGLIAITLFYVVIIFVAVWAARRKKTNDVSENAANEFMLAGRNIGVVVGTFSMTATWVSAVYINGTAAIIYQHGFASAHATWCYSLSLIIGGILFAKRMREAGYITMLDPLQEKYGNIMGAILYIPALFAELCWSAVIFAYLGSSLTFILNINSTYSVIISACVVIFYTFVGGLQSIVHTNVLHLICVLVGLSIAIPFAMLNEHVDKLSNTKSQWMGEIKSSQLGAWIDSALLMILGGIPWQVYFQRVLSSNCPRSAQIMSFSAAFGCLVMSIPVILLAAISKSTDWQAVVNPNTTSLLLNDGSIKDPKLSIPMVLYYLTPTWVSVVGLGAITAAVMSSVDSSMLSTSSMFAYNIHKIVFRHKASPKELMWVLRLGIITAGCIATTMGLTLDNIYHLWMLSADLVYVTLFPQLLSAIYLKFVNVYGSIACLMAGLVLRICGGDPILGIPALIEYPLYNEDKKLQFFPFRTFAMGASLVILILVSVLTNYLLEETVRPSQDEIDIIRISYKEPERDNTITSFSKISRFSGSYNNITASAIELRAREDKSLLKSTLSRSNSNRYPKMLEVE